MGGVVLVFALAVGCAAPIDATPTPAATTSPSAVPSVAGQQVTLGSNYADEVPRAALRAVLDDFTASSGIEVVVNTVAPQQFQERISTYLQGRPDDAFSWFAGNRMRFFADQGLVGDVSELWPAISEHHSEAVRIAATASDGRQYFVPFITYPVAVMYRASVWESRGYSEPRTWDEFIALGDQMRADGLVPIAFGDREGWPAMAWFDILNLRLNGYQFHIDLLEGRERWTDSRAKRVFERWRLLLPYLQSAAQGRTWQEAARSMIAGDAGMIYLGTYVAEQASAEERADLRIFPFPLLGTEFDAEASLEAPINGFMLSRSPAEPDAARALLAFLATPDAQVRYVTENPSRIAAARDADMSAYTPLQHQMAELIAGAGRLAQFFDRDTRPDFAGANGMQAFLHDFLDDPEQDLDAYLAGIQQFWDSLD